MKQAWLEPATTRDAQVSLGSGYPRDEIDVARGRCVAAMRDSLGRTPRLGTAAVPGNAAGAITSSAEGTLRQ
jgi:hypothetical protein